MLGFIWRCFLLYCMFLSVFGFIANPSLDMVYTLIIAIVCFLLWRKSRKNLAAKKAYRSSPEYIEKQHIKDQIFMDVMANYWQNEARDYEIQKRVEDEVRKYRW